MSHSGHAASKTSATAKPEVIAHSTSAQQNNVKQNNLELQYWPPNKMATIAQLNAVRAENQRLIYLWIIDNSKTSYIIYKTTRRHTQYISSPPKM